MGGHRALLLFVPAFRSPDWPALDYLRDEYARMGTALAARGYAIDDAGTCEAAELTRAGITRRIGDFLRGGRPGDLLLVYLSGHGFHHEGLSWFAGYDSEPDADNVAVLGSGNVPLDESWAKAADASRAAQVLFVVDACRERLVDDRVTRRRPFTTPPDTEKLSYLMACEPEAPSAFAGEGDGDGAASRGFSLLTRALEDILGDVHDDLPADRLHRLLAEEMADLRERAEHRLPRGLRQEPRLSGEHGRNAFPFLPQAARPEQERAARLSEHAVWERTDRRAQRRLRKDVETVTTALGAQLADDRRRLAGNPWLDWTADLRASDNVAFLVREFLPDVTFSPAEAALLTLVPLLHHALRVQRAKDLEFELRRLDESDEFWDRYAPLLHRTAADREPRPRATDRRTVRAWILHQEKYRLDDDPGGPVEGLRELLNQAFRNTWELPDQLDAELLAWMFRALQHGGSILAEPPAVPESRRIRLRLVGYLLAAAHTMALDLVELPRVLVDHARSQDGASLLRARRTVQEAVWQRSGQSLRLTASCGHQAMMVALQEHAAYLDGLLHHAGSRSRAGRDGGDGDPECLAALPQRASGDDVLPEKDERTGAMRFLPVATRFGLDGSRVRDLLTGEQLYRDRKLAVRELYQNAMDACRVREAREQHRPPHRPHASAAAGPGKEPGKDAAEGASGQVGRQAGTDPGEDLWEGRIEVRQGGRGSRRYLECVDNGSGMDRDELLYAFAQGGARLSHLASFRQEQREWEKNPRISFHRNSRFGIGVLSYFMLADEIEVTTRKFRPDRGAGELLRVTVFGPDDLFQVDDQAQDTDFLGDRCGTRVRLYLNARRAADLSGVQALRGVLGVARYRTTATYEDQHEREVWDPQDFRPRPGSGITAAGRVVADPRGDVFWCERGGAILVDGIVVETAWPPPSDDPSGPGQPVRPFGAVVNLRGPVQISGKGRVVPRLSVDRAQVLDDVTRPILNRLRDAVDSLAGSGLLTPRWLQGAADADPRIADEIVRELGDIGAELTDDHGTYPLGRTGYFPGDEELRAVWAGASSHVRSTRNPDDDTSAPRLPSHLALWRYVAHAPEEVARHLGSACPPGLATTPVLPAVPSHALVLGHPLDDSYQFQWDDKVQVEHLIKYTRALGASTEHVTDLLGTLNRPVEPPGPQPGIPLQSLRFLISQDSDGEWPWLPPGATIPTLNVLLAAEYGTLRPADLVLRLRALGYATDACDDLLEPGSPGDQRIRLLLSEHLDGRAPWRRSIGSDRLVAAADALDMSIADLRTRLAGYGVTVPSERTAGERDRVLIQTLQQLRAARVDPGTPVEPLHLRCLAARLRLGVRQCARRLTALGYTVPQDDLVEPPAPPALVDALLALEPAVDIAAAIPLPPLRSLGTLLKWSMAHTAQQLRDMGADVPVTGVPESLDASDVRLLTKYLQRPGPTASTPWLDPRRPVPAAHVVLAAAALGVDVAQVTARLHALGMRLDGPPDGLADVEVGLEYEERALVGHFIDYGPASEALVAPWGHLLAVAAERDWSVETALARFAERGLTVAQPVPAREGVSDLVLLSRAGDGRGPFLPSTVPVSAEQVVRAARAAGVSVAEARARLLELRAAPSKTPPSGEAHPADDTIARPWWLESWPRQGTGEAVPAAEVRMMAAENNLTLRETADRVVAAGLTLQDGDYPDERPHPEELLLLRENCSPLNSWWDTSRPVGLEHLLVTARHLDCDVLEAAERLRALGLTVPDVHATFAEAWELVPKA